MRRAFILVALLGVMLVGCDGAANPTKVQPATASGTVDYGSNVHYFPFTGAIFGSKLATFIEKHPELEMVSMTSKNQGGYGATEGYFVHFREKGPCVCEDMGPQSRDDVRRDSP